MKTPSFKIVKNSESQRAIKLANGSIIPADIAALATGKDKWMSEVKCKCRECGEYFPLKQLQGGGQWCEQCQQEDVEA